MTGCLISLWRMCLETADQNIPRNFVLATERKASSHSWFAHFIFSKRNFKNCSLFGSYQIHSIFCRSKYQTLLPPHFCPYAFSQFFLVLPHFPILFAPPLPACSLCVYSPEMAAAHADASQWINGGTVSIGTWKEPGSPFFPTHVFVLWPDWLMKEFCSNYDT